MQVNCVVLYDNESNDINCNKLHVKFWGYIVISILWLYVAILKYKQSMKDP